MNGQAVGAAGRAASAAACGIGNCFCFRDCCIFFFIFSLPLSHLPKEEEQQGARSLSRSLARSLAPMSAYITPSPAQGRRNNGGGGSTAFETPASGALSQHHRSSETINNGFDSDASLSSVGALARDLPPYASSPPIEAVVFAWGERDERES